jgi:hypothetical protein
MSTNRKQGFEGYDADHSLWAGAAWFMGCDNRGQVTGYVLFTHMPHGKVPMLRRVVGFILDFILTAHREKMARSALIYWISFAERSRQAG